MSPSLTAILWGALLAVNAIILAVWASSTWWAALPLAIAAVSAVVLGALLWRAAVPGRVRAIPDSSASSAALVPGLAMLALAPAAGVWLALLGAGVTVLAAAGLVREWIGLRRRRPPR